MENFTVNEDSYLVNLLKTMLCGDSNTVERKKLKKIDISAGKSVGGADFSESTDSEVDMSLHDSDSNIGPEDFREKEEEYGVSYLR
ncbi:hypothetical protein FQR65_LT05408 [Abscondita terminalis]|nr:hypothetical protein FQR65_LT05408 [Abscondita terminalis]